MWWNDVIRQQAITWHNDTKSLPELMLTKFCNAILCHTHGNELITISVAQSSRKNSWVNAGHFGENPNIIMYVIVGQRQP